MMGCSIGGNQSGESQVEVSRGDLTITVNGNGKTEYTSDAALSFGSAGKVAEVKAREGAAVKKGDILAKLETDELELSLSEALLAQAQAETSLTQALQAETQAQIALTSAQFNLDLTEDVAEIKDKITDTQWEITIAQLRLKEARSIESDAKEYWMEALANYEIELAKYQNKLAELLSQDEYTGVVLYNIYGQKYDRVTLEDIRLKQLQVESAELSIQQAEQNTIQAQRALDQANRAVAVTQKQLNNAVITAPFDGQIAQVNIKKGDILTTPGTTVLVPIYMIDPATLVVKAEIDELDIAGVKIGQPALIKVDALKNTEIEGTVSDISVLPAAKLQSSGIVVYEVKVDFTEMPESIKSGMNASVDIILESKTNVLIVPNKAIKTNDSGVTVVQVVENDKVVEREVVCGSTNGTRTEIIRGLTEGELVISAAVTVDLKAL